MSSTWCELGAATVRNGVLYVRCKGGAVDEDGTAPDYGDAPMMCALGVTAVPFPPTIEGAAEGVCSRDVPGLNGVIGLARDVRTANIAGKLQPGDTCVYSTGPLQAAILLLKEATRTAALIVKAKSGKNSMFVLDGDAEEVQLTHAGAIFKFQKNGDVICCGAGGAGFLIEGGNFHILGNPVLGAGNPPGFCIALCPPSGSPGGPASTPLLPMMGVTPGT